MSTRSGEPTAWRNVREREGVQAVYVRTEPAEDTGPHIVHVWVQPDAPPRTDETPVRLDTDDARTVREAGARFASDLAGAAWVAFMVALDEQGERLRRAVLAAGHGPEQARLAAAEFEAAARDEWVWHDAAVGTPPEAHLSRSPSSPRTRAGGTPAAAYAWHVAPGGVMVVVDLDRPGWNSVTNDAAGVVADLAELRPDIFACLPLIPYRDSDGRWDGLRVGPRGAFLGFAPIGAATEAEAVAHVLEERGPCR